MTRYDIKRVFLAHGFTIDPDKEDLDERVYLAVSELLDRDRAARAGVPFEAAATVAGHTLYGSREAIQAACGFLQQVPGVGCHAASADASSDGKESASTNVRWNFRMVRTTTAGETLLEVKEVHYDAEGKPHGYGNSCVSAEDANTVSYMLERMREAVAHPVLDETDFV